MDISTLADEANTADWIAAIGQATGALFTAVAVAVALGIALADSRRRKKEDEERGRRNARMVLVRGQGANPLGQGQAGYTHELMIYFSNHGNQPIFDVHAEAWAGGDALDEGPRWAVTSEIVKPGEPADPNEFKMVVETPDPQLTLAAWRIRWTDVDGRDWCGDTARQHQPLPFTGQPPRPYGRIETKFESSAANSFMQRIIPWEKRKSDDH